MKAEVLRCYWGWPSELACLQQMSGMSAMFAMFAMTKVLDLVEAAAVEAAPANTSIYETI